WAVIDRSYHTVYRRLLYSTFPIASRHSHENGHEQPARTVASDVGSADGKERATIRLAPGVPNLLHEWRGGGKTQSLLSMWFHSELVELITELGLAELFTHVNGLRAETGGGSKAEHLVAHLSAKGLDPARVVVIGDVADDAVAAERAGAHCVLVSSGMMDRRALRAANVPVVDSIDHAMRLVHDWAGPRQRGADE
ncbi:MAG: HAD family hydrolase, partial [Mycobacterium sp.]|nr:HAD family hydrolase [Mycobacterium sp.]